MKSTGTGFSKKQTMIKVLLSVLGLSYLVSPYDLFPDFFVGVGWVDDLIVLGVLWWYLYVYRPKQKRYEGAGGNRDQNEARESREGKGDSDSKREEPAFTRATDPYTILNVDRNASQKEIRAAYRVLANQYHPDKVAHLGEEFGELAEIRFKEIQSAYEALRVK